MRFRTHLIRNLLAVIGLFLLGAVLVISNISISLDKVRPVLVNALSQTLGREVNIEGDIRLSTGLFPALLIESLYAKNPEGFPDDYSLRISRAEAELSLIALVAGDYHFTEISSNDVQVNLHRKNDGTINWAFRKPQSAGNSSSLKEKLSIDRFRLSNVTFKVRDEMLSRGYNDHLDTLNFEVRNSDEVRLDVTATFKEIPYSLEIKANPFRYMFGKKDWALHATGEIAHQPFESVLSLKPGEKRDSHDLEFRLSMASANLLVKSKIQPPANGFEQNVAVSLSGRNLHEMAQLLDIELPVIADYSLKSDIEIASKRVNMSDIDAQIDNLNITGSVGLDTSKS